MVSPARSMSRQGCPANTPTTGTSTLAARAKIRTVRASSARGAHRTQRGDGAGGPQRGAGFHHRHHDDHRTDRERIGELTEYCREDRDGDEQQLQGSVKDSSSSFHHGSDLRGAMVLGPWWGPASGPLVLIQAQRGRSSTTPRRAVGPRRATPVRRRGSPLVRSCRRRLLLGPGREVTLTLGWGRCASAG